MNCKFFNNHKKTQNDSAKKKKARSKRRFEEVDIADDDQVRAEPKKLLKIITTASGAFLEEPMTPEKKNKFAFQGKFFTSCQTVNERAKDGAAIFNCKHFIASYSSDSTHTGQSQLPCQSFQSKQTQKHLH